MVKIKICGITNRVDAMNAVSLGADALGFIFSKSPRQMTPIEVKKIIQVLPPYITCTGVFVNEALENVLEIMDFCKLDIVQLHGDESPEYGRKIPYRIVKTFRVKDKESLNVISKYISSS
ncbi:phosphoribosylanthranilate isomerase, partial [Candidatus Desantisbacteria bacterium]|nr:phosphoribosylanthranilate isomerase [Candidatus Desantisbacteria bacterium]